MTTSINLITEQLLQLKIKFLHKSLRKRIILHKEILKITQNKQTLPEE